MLESQAVGRAEYAAGCRISLGRSRIKVFASNNLQSLPTEQPTANDDHHHRVDHTETHDKRDAKMPQPLIGEHDSGSETDANINV